MIINMQCASRSILELVQKLPIRAFSYRALGFTHGCPNRGAGLD
jgi:hypothetical protein